MEKNEFLKFVKRNKKELAMGGLLVIGGILIGGGLTKGFLLRNFHMIEKAKNVISWVPIKEKMNFDEVMKGVEELRKTDELFAFIRTGKDTYEGVRLALGK
jgi:hypothetical protein